MTLVFDYDGTLHDTKKLYGRALRRVCSWLSGNGYIVPDDLSDDSVSKYLGVNAPDMWNDFMPELPLKIKKQASSMVGQEMISGVLSGEPALYPGVPEMLDALRAKGHRMVILSNCRTSYMDAHRSRYGLDKWFDGYFCAEAYSFIPKEEIFLSLNESFPDSQYIIIGDRASDFRVGTTHGFPVIGCAYGFGTAEERSVCTAVAQKPEEITSLVDTE